MDSNKSAQDVYDAHVARAANESRLTLQRNAAAAGSVTALLIILQLLQAGVADPLREYAVLAAAIAIPLFTAVSAVYHAHIVAGKVTYGHLAVKYVAGSLGFVQLVASLLLLAAIGLCVWSLSPRSGAMFGLVTGISGLIMIVFHASMIRYVLRSTRDESSS